MDVLPEMNHYFKNCEVSRAMVYCIRKHLFKEDPKTLPKSRTILKMYVIIAIMFFIKFLINIIYSKIFLYDTIKFLLAYKIYGKVTEYLQNYYYEHKLVIENSTFYSDIK